MNFSLLSEQAFEEVLPVVPCDRASIHITPQAQSELDSFWMK